MGDVQIRLQNMNIEGTDESSLESTDVSSLAETDGFSSEKTDGFSSEKTFYTGDHYADDVNVTPADENAAGGSPEIMDSSPDQYKEPSQAYNLEEENSESDDTLIAAMEAILFAMGEAVPIDSIAQTLCVPKWKAMEMADVLSERYRNQSSGVSLNWYEESVQLSTKPELYEYLIRIAAEPKKPKLTPTLLETLSIIAFRQPVTRMEVENIRGVNSDFAINRLISFDLVEEVGRKEVPGRPLLFGTTQQFLRSFGIRSVEELPEPDTSHMEAFREEAEEEVSSKLDI